ncbi:MAG: hypothetical protein GF313_07960 [Caldithrix sp.]|nr:hypothetical protein [Caldithrix sp.]
MRNNIKSIAVFVLINILLIGVGQRAYSGDKTLKLRHLTYGQIHYAGFASTNLQVYKLKRQEREATSGSGVYITIGWTSIISMLMPGF